VKQHETQSPRSRSFPQQRSGDIEVYSPEEVWALVRAAASSQDTAIYLTAAFTGLRRGELVALRTSISPARRSGCARAFDDAEEREGSVRTNGSGGRVGAGQAGRPHALDGDDDLVFVGVLGSHLDGSSLRRRYDVAVKAARIRPLRFHDLRHTFGTRMIAKADIRRVQEWMGHADVQTTMKYLHYVPRPDDAALVAEAFKVEPVAPTAQTG
jgi:integrase